MRKIIFTIACMLFVACASLVIAPIMGTLTHLMSVDTAASMFAHLIHKGAIYACTLFGSFVVLLITSE